LKLAKTITMQLQQAGLGLGVDMGPASHAFPHKHAHCSVMHQAMLTGAALAGCIPRGSILNSWHKQGNGFPTPLGRADLALQFFFPVVSENDFEAGFSRAKVQRRFHFAIAAGEISNFGPRKVGLKIVSRLQEENRQGQGGTSQQFPSWSQGPDGKGELPTADSRIVDS
jgi:hypothetical protein